MCSAVSPCCAMAPEAAARCTSAKVVVSNSIRKAPSLIPFVGSLLSEAGQFTDSNGFGGGGSPHATETKVTTAANIRRRFTSSLTVKLRGRPEALD
jgi:hypothetical protein